MEYNSRRADMLLALAKDLEEKLNDANDEIRSLRRENEGLKEGVKTPQQEAPQRGRLMSHNDRSNLLRDMERLFCVQGHMIHLLEGMFVTNNGPGEDSISMAVDAAAWEAVLAINKASIALSGLKEKLGSTPWGSTPC